MNTTKSLLSSMLFIAFAIPGMARENRLIDSEWKFSFTPDSTSTLASFTKNVDLPHDWSIEFPFEENTLSGTEGGYVQTGKGTYVKDISISEKELNDSRFSLLFEGVYERWTLKVNGQTVGFRPYGYSSVIYDITPYLHAGINTLQVEVDNSNQKNSRWYSGSGIYRHVRLIRTSDVAVAPWSLFISTPEVSSSEAVVDVVFDIDGLESGKTVDANLSVIDPEGVEVASGLIKDIAQEGKCIMTVQTPQLWSPDSPALYTLRLMLMHDGKEVDAVQEKFGIRSISYSASDGFRLNGKEIVLNGACAHHDNGMLGAAAFDAAEARKVRLLKEAGFNAVRTSHNPPSPSFLDECDRQGLFVIDEAFDGWRESKTPNDYHLWIDEWGVNDMGDLVRRDRNHPSVIAWSIGNEVIERKKIEVVSTARKLAGECRRLDPTRPVTEALCAWDRDWEIFDPHAEALDVVGYNYMIFKSESDHQRCPERVMWQTESYPRDAAANWHKVNGSPYIIGDFVWTGIDYLGESGIGRYYYEGQTPGEHWQAVQWPWHGAYCGDIDITGWRKPISHYRDMLYNGDEKIYMAVREPNGYNGEIKETMWSVWPTWESWNWRGHEGKPIDVEIISRYPKVRLYLDDSLIGEKSAGEANDCIAMFTLPYTPGTLRAVGVDDNGTELDSVSLATAGNPAAIRLTPDKTSYSADGQDLVFVIAEVVDSEGRVVPDTDIPLEFSVSGAGSLKAAGSADLTDNDGYSDAKTRTWKGRAMMVMRASDRKGTATISVKSPGIKASSIKLKGF